MKRPLLCAALLCGALVSASGAIAADSDGTAILRSLAEKARQRETGLDGILLKWSGQAKMGEAPIPVATMSGQWARSGPQRRSELQAVTGAGARQKTSLTMVSDGDRASVLADDNGRRQGFVAKASPDTLMNDFSPERLAITGLWQLPGRLSEMLDDPAAYSAKYSDVGILRGADFSAAYSGERAVGDRNCRIVDLGFQAREGDNRLQCELAFAPEFGDACVTIDISHVSGDRRRSHVVVEMADFREARPGVWIPAAGVVRAYDENGKLQGSLELKVDSLEFPGSFPDGFFTIQFPAGTQVRDTFANLDYTIGPPADIAEVAPLPETESTAEAVPADMEPPAAVEEPPAAPAPPVAGEAAQVPETPAGKTWVSTAVPVAVIVAGLLLLIAIGRKTIGPR